MKHYKGKEGITIGRLEGKTALVTGASRGIGRAIAVKMAQEGAFVIINYSSDDKNAEKTLKIIEDNGGYGKLLKKSVESLSNCDYIVKEVIDEFGKIDILVNNAGISLIGLFMDASQDEIEKIVNINLMGNIYMTKCVLKHMVSKGYGRIVNISSMWGETGASCEALYSATKGGINGFTKAIAKEMAMADIRINAIAPGVIDTAMNSSLDEETKEELKKEIPMGRFGIPEEIAKAAVFLCSDESSYITGQILRIDGGFI